MNASLRTFLLTAGIALTLAALACGGAPAVQPATQAASFSTATPGGSISISLLTPTLTQPGIVNPDARPIGPIATATAEAALSAAATGTAAVLVPTPTIPGVFSEPALCPPPGTATLPPAPPAFPRYAERIVEFLSAGGAPTVLEASLRTWGSLTEYGGLVRADRDFTADGVPEVLVVAFDPASRDLVPQPGDLFLFGCEEGAYRLLYQAGYSIDRGAPVLHSADDLNGDRINDLVYAVQTCGEVSCQTEVFIFEWSLTLENFTSLLSSAVIQPNAEIVVSDVDEDSLTEVSITRGIIPLTEAGPQREITTVYKWDGTLYAVAEVVRPVAEYRIHVIHDADEALLSGDYEAAIEGFRDAFRDEDLRSWSYPNEAEHLTAYARFHLMLTYLRAGNLTAAQKARDDLIAVYNPPPCDPASDPACQPPTPSIGPAPGLEFARMADLFWAEYSVNRRLDVACTLVVGYARANPFALDVLNSFGFANRQYTAFDMCPWAE